MSNLDILSLFPNAPEKEIKQAIKYQEKFSLTLDNLKCLNPECNNIRKWMNTVSGFGYCCSHFCGHKMKENIINIAKIKANETYFNKTGYIHNSHNPDVQQKKKETYFNRTGYEHQALNPDVQQKKKETYFNRTGYENPSYDPKVKGKRKETYFKKYGKYNAVSDHFNNYFNWDDKQYWIDNFITKDNNFNYIKGMKYFNCCQTTIHNQIKNLNIEYSKIGGTSLKEQALYPFLDSLNFIYETNVRNIIDNLELDIYFPELDLAIEYNGLYWHSYHEAIGTSPNQLDHNYMKYRHQAKSLACYGNGIRLLHIYEDTVNIENLILDFINYKTKGSLKEPKSYELDSGCYRLGLEYEILEPESRIVLGDRLLFNAGKIIKE